MAHFVQKYPALLIARVEYKVLLSNTIQLQRLSEAQECIRARESGQSRRRKKWQPAKVLATTIRFTVAVLVSSTKKS